MERDKRNDRSWCVSYISCQKDWSSICRQLPSAFTLESGKVSLYFTYITAGGTECEREEPGDQNIKVEAEFLP